VAENALRIADLKAIVFDVDGTLYRQSPLRRAMLQKLVVGHLTNPLRGWQTMRILSAYRHAQEHLRGASGTNVADAQLAMACERTKLGRAAVTACVERWMEQEPLSLLARFLQPGLIEFLDASQKRGLKLAALSDYPVDAKLRALGVADRFELTLCAQAPEIGVFKPDPRGLIVALERLGLTPAQTLYVGDRVDVDAAAAAAAGIPCAILTRQHDGAGTHVVVTDYFQLHDLLFRDANATGASRSLNQVA
jgi:HAD superfamily hydrolase (TIGR01549 family)